MSWQSTLPFATLKARANFIRDIRAFFEERAVLEVDSPLLMPTVNNDPFINAFSLNDSAKAYFLQTSPEFAMKRLLASQSELKAIYYLGKAFRQGEQGNHHNPEFTILEWYRAGVTHLALMDEVGLLLKEQIGAPAPSIKSYADLFKPLGLNPHTATTTLLAEFAQDNHIGGDDLPEMDQVGWLEWIFYHAIEKKFDPSDLMIVHEFPVSLAQLARREPHPIQGEVASRFEVYYQGFELANGYDELTDAHEQKQRFLLNNETRHKHGLNRLPVDEKLIAALEKGLPQMSGVAMGVDRMLMIKLRVDTIGEVLPFDWGNI